MKDYYLNTNISPANFESIVVSYNDSNLKICSNSDPLSGSMVMNFVCPDYSNNLINTLYDTNFSEFVDEPVISTIESDVQTEIVSTEPVNLDNPEIISDSMMTRDTIIQLRIELGQGNDASQFSTEFPYERI